MHVYPDIKVKNSGPTDTSFRKEAVQNPGSKRFFTKQPTYLPPIKNNKRNTGNEGSEKNLGRSSPCLPCIAVREKKTLSPCDDKHATRKKMNASVFLARPLRAEYTQTTEPVWLSRAVKLLLSVEDKYLHLLNIDLRDHFEEQYALLGKPLS